MSYPATRPGRPLLPIVAILILAIGLYAFVPGGNYIYCLSSGTPKVFKNALYNRDTLWLGRPSGIVRMQRNGDIVIAAPIDASGRYRVRFFDDKQALLFEIRQIRDPLLIIEKYNFGHAGLFHYELFRDNGLIERGSFHINP